MTTPSPAAVLIPTAEIVHGNCLDVMATMASGSVDLTVTSPPPYDNLRTYEGYEFDFEAIAQELYRVTKPGGVLVWVVGDESEGGCESGTSFRQALYFQDVCKFNRLDTMIYAKETYFPRHNHRCYPQAFEYAFVMVKPGGRNTFNLLRDRRNRWAGDKHSMTVRKPDGSLKPSHSQGGEVPEFGPRNNVWTYSVGKGHTMGPEDYEIAKRHPAPFPEALARDHILSWSNEGELVFDPMLGSGTTAKMAVLNRRNFKGCDVTEEYCEMGRKRVALAVAQLKAEALRDSQLALRLED